MYFFTQMANRHFSVTMPQIDLLISSCVILNTANMPPFIQLSKAQLFTFNPILSLISLQYPVPWQLPPPPLPNHIPSCHFTASSLLTLQPKLRPPLLWPVLKLLNSSFLLHFPWSSQQSSTIFIELKRSKHPLATNLRQYPVFLKWLILSKFYSYPNFIQFIQMPYCVLQGPTRLAHCLHLYLDCHQCPSRSLGPTHSGLISVLECVKPFPFQGF